MLPGFHGNVHNSLHPHPPLQVFTLLNLLLETMGPELRPQVGLLLAALPHIWQGAAGQSLLRIQVRRMA